MRARASRPAAPRVHVLNRARGGWQPRARELRDWTALTLGRRGARAEISVLLAGPARSRALNARYRGRRHATNVLSFPAPPGAAGALLGDLVICPQVLRREARAQRKSQRAHWAHLYVHGLLHLIGYDHERDAQAQRMQRREIAVLRRLGIANPYSGA